MSQPSSELWATSQWRDHAQAWIDLKLAEHGLERIGPVVQVRIRPWSTLLTVPVGDSTVWMKACTQEAAYEAALVGILAKRVPEVTLEPIALDREQGRLLLPDGGPIVREVVDPGHIGEVWEKALTFYANMQRQLVSSVPEIVAAGVPDMSPDRLPGILATTIERVGGPVEAEPSFTEACDRLKAGPVPSTIQHDDFHTGNVFAGPGGTSDPVFFDWGDAYVGHPFSSLLVAIRVMALDEPDPARIRRVCDAYLEVWTDLAPRSELYDLARDAMHVAKLGRALGWERALSRATVAEVDEWENPVEEWLDELAESVSLPFSTP